MKNFFDRPFEEQDAITRAYDFEITAIEKDDPSRNPYVDTIKTWPDGKEIWEAINEAVEMAYT